MKKHILAFLSALLVIVGSTIQASAYFDPANSQKCPTGQAYYNADGYVDSSGEYIKNYTGCGTGKPFTCTDGSVVYVPDFYLPLNEYKFHELCPTPTAKIPAVMISVAVGEYLNSQTEGTANITLPQSAEGKVLIFSSKDYINWVISNPNNVTPAKIVLIAAMDVNAQGNVDIAHHQRLSGSIPNVRVEKPYVPYPTPSSTYFLKNGYTISQADTYTAERAGDLPKSISPSGTPFGDKVQPTTMKYTCPDGRSIDVPYGAGGTESISICKGLPYVDFNAQFLGPNGIKFTSYVVASATPMTGYQRTYEAYDFQGDGQMKKFYEHRTLEAVKVGWGTVSIGDTLPMKIEARGANSCEVTSTDGLRVVPPAIEDISWKVVPATGKISSYDSNLLYSNYAEYVEMAEISRNQSNGLGYRALYTTLPLKSPSTTFTVTCWFPPSISWGQYKAHRSSIGVNTLNKNTAIAVSKSVTVSAVTTATSSTSSSARGLLDTYRIYNPSMVQQYTGSNPYSWDLRDSLLSYVHTVIDDGSFDENHKRTYTPKQFTEQEAYAWCNAPRSDTDYLMCFWNNKFIYAKDETGVIDLTNTNQKSRVSNMPTLTHNGVVYGKQTGSGGVMTPSSLVNTQNNQTVYQRSNSSSSADKTQETYTSTGLPSSAGETKMIYQSVAQSNTVSSVKKAYRQYYGALTQQSRSRVTKEEAVRLCNTRISATQSRKDRGLKTYADVTKVRCTWNGEQFYPVEEVSTLTTTPQVLGASTDSLCLNVPRNMHRGHNEPREVLRLQSFLAQKGFLEEDNVTGFYGDKTIEAVKDYQASVGLPVTGMTYSLTREAMRMESCR